MSIKHENEMTSITPESQNDGSIYCEFWPIILLCHNDQLYYACRYSLTEMETYKLYLSLDVWEWHENDRQHESQCDGNLLEVWNMVYHPLLPQLLLL